MLTLRRSRNDGVLTDAPHLRWNVHPSLSDASRDKLEAALAALGYASQMASASAASFF
jgi:hypothetical protein